MGDAVAMAVGDVGHVFGAWGAPPDAPAKAALVAAVIALAIAVAPKKTLRELAPAEAPFTFLCALAAAALSLGYAAYYLRGAPRIVDATSYFLQGRALSEGHFAWHVPEPSASFRGRFELAHDGAIAGIFPPGYPLLLSLGFAVGAPLLIGPALAAAIVLATSALAKEVARDAGLDDATVTRVGHVAAVLSVASAALRYHTADTMAHGACALAFAIALRAALRARALPWFFLIAGLALGWVASARFASALALGAVLAACAWTSRSRANALVAIALGVLPGLALLAIAQAAVTGSALASTQAAYYATSDGPPGCFRWGFGAGIGCMVEHGDFVRAGLAPGGVSGGATALPPVLTYFGAKAALFTTLRRLAYHLGDVLNLEPLALLALVPIAATRSRAARWCGALVVAQVLAYAPFYFDGDYPGGGARFFADVLPIEHALIAVAIALVAARLRVDAARPAAAVVALALAGFGAHAAYAHDSLRDRDGGRPMFDPAAVARAHVNGGAILFVDSDHGFALAHDPEVAERAARDGKPPSDGLVVARLRNDDHDRLLYERLGHPAAWSYRFRPQPPKTLGDVVAGDDESADVVEPWNPIVPALADTWRFEAEAEWPPLAQRGAAWAEPMWASGTCATGGRALQVRAEGPGDVVIDLPIPHAGTWHVTPHLFFTAESRGAGEITVGEPPIATWQVAPAPTNTNGAPCVALPPHDVTTTTASSLSMTLRCPAACAIALDRVEVASAAARPR